MTIHYGGVSAHFEGDDGKRTSIPVNPGPGGVQFGMTPDGPNAWCVACGQSWAPRTRRTVAGVLLMLCDDPIGCTHTYRRGATPVAYAAGLATTLTAPIDWKRGVPA